MASEIGKAYLVSDFLYDRIYRVVSHCLNRFPRKLFGL